MIRKMKRQNVGARVLATAMSAAMGLSSFSAALPGGVVYAENGETNAEASEETVQVEVTDVEASEEQVAEENVAETAAEEAASEETVSEETVSEEATSEEKAAEELAEVMASEEETVVASDRSFDTSKTDVWDFGAEDLGDAYNNRLDVDTINGFYSVAARSTGVNISSFSVDDGDFVFNDGGYPTTHRLRTTNSALTHYDEKSLKDSDGNVYSGYLYSNKGSTADVYVAVECQADDVITAYVASNGTDSNVTFENVGDSSDSVFFTHSLGSGTVSKFVYYPAQTAQYKLYSATEKLVVARVLRQHAEYSYLTGSVEGFEGTGSFDVVFTNRQNGNVVKATVGDGSFSVKLAEGFDYDITLEGADEYVITSDKSVNIDADTEIAMTVKGVDLVEYTGKVTGVAQEDAQEFADGAAFRFVPQNPDSVFVPEITLAAENGAITYSVRLQNGVAYDVQVADKEDTNAVNYAVVDDYNLLTTQITVDGAKDDFAIELEAKPVYNVTVVPVGATAEDLAEAVLTFTRLDTSNDFVADGYVYEFTGTEGIALRDGQYVVEVTNAGAFVQKLTSNLIVNGADVSKEIAFSSDITEWDFSDAAFAAKFAGAVSGTYNGLSWTNGRSHNGVYLYSGAGVISVPVKGSCQIQVTANYQYSYYFDNETEPTVGVKTGSTSQNDTFTYDYKGGAGTFDITVLGTSYITKIATVYQTEYKAELLVGSSADADYATISEALDAVALMNRADGERVTIKVEPGDYEEMLVVDVPNVTLENASATPTNTLKNSGVDIDDNAVRVTWYYGHGYTYYSMAGNYKYDADVLAVNKANGYASVINPGSGTATYWNASVVVNAAGFEAKNIIFENSFNQYVSKKAAEDVIVPQSGAKEGKVARAAMAAGDTTVQEKAYVERAAALALTSSAKESYFENCRIIGRQDTLYGAVGTTAAFYNCAVYGGTDYIFGGMTAVFAKCDLVLNTSEDKNDVAYITAPQQQSSTSRGYLMYNCKVTSTVPGVDTASSYTSKPGQFGRPWQANTSEVVFFDTVVDATNWSKGADGKYVYDASAKTSLIQPEGWNATLSGQSARCVEFGTYEISGENNSASRVDWVQRPETAVCADGTAISVGAFLGSWDPFTANNKDMTIVFPDGSETPAPAPAPATEEPAASSKYVLNASDLQTVAQNVFVDGETLKAGTDDRFEITFSSSSSIDENTKTFDDGFVGTKRINFRKPASLDYGTVKFTTNAPAEVKIWWVAGDAGRAMTILDKAGSPVVTSEPGTAKNGLMISKLDLEAAGTYYLGGDIGSNYIFCVEVTEEETAEPVVSVLESKDIEIGVKADGQTETAGTDGFFTMIYSGSSKVEEKSVTFADGYTSDRRISLGKLETTDKNAVMFKTASDNAELKIWWVSNAKPLILMTPAGDVLEVAEAGDKNAQYITTYTIEKAGTYFLGSKGGTDYLFKVQVTDGTPSEVVRKAWSEVEAPVVTDVTVNDNSKIVVKVKSEIGTNGGDELVATMFDRTGNELGTARSLAEGTDFEFTFAPVQSGDYYFTATLSREGEETVKVSEKSTACSYVLPLMAPAFKNAVNKGNGKLTVKFYSSPEATEYKLVATDLTDNDSMEKATVTPEEVTITNTVEYNYTFTKLNVGHTYRLTLVAVRGEDVSAESTMDVEVKADGEQEWTFSAFGSGVSSSSSNNGYSVNNDGTISVWSTGNKGKIVPASTDGLSFYYATIPADKNFTLTATATIDSWTFTNGQEGFGLMAADRVGVNGDASVFWNNSYMASGTKVEYYYDPVKGEVTTDSNGAKITMKNGLGAQQKVGVTKDNLARLEANDTATVTEEFSSSMYTLETSCASNGAGTYNIWGKEQSGTASTVANPMVQVRLRIQKNNTGYFVSYLDENDNVIAIKKFYDTKALEQIDSDNVYVGFYASRTFKVTFSDIALDIIAPEDDEPAEGRPVSYVAPNYGIISATYSNTAKYDLQYSGNADGVLTITDAMGNVVVDAQAVTAGSVTTASVKLAKGDNTFAVTFTPNADFHPENDEYLLLESYEAAEFTHTVKYNTINSDEKIYVTPDGSADADGSANSPVDIYTAVKYVQPGQTIVVKAGTYSLSSTVTVARGIDGTPSKPIKLVAEGGRAIFDFNKKCAGFIFAGDYWYVNGIDCTHSGNSLKGIQVSGSHITLEDVRTYENGNTGIQVSRFLSTDSREEWPSYDLILNCTSYSNADAGYEDADGFAAKLTVGEGIVFDGCIAYNNADDGWDLFAKVETGNIGQVTIQNSVAFANGFGVDGTNEGNGNGFKMGGSSITGPHKLINSVAWGNKAKGIDSNSGPDIQVYNSMSFNNGSNNVALYTNDTANTNYYVDGVLSYRTTGTGTNENIKAKGTQDKNNIYGKLNFFWNDGASANSEGLKVTDDWFVSLDAPYASANDPFAVAASLRTADGSIDLGDFLRLSDTGLAAFEAAGITASDVVAVLGGQYESVKDEREIAGSSEDAAKVVEEEEPEEPVEPEVQGEFVTKWGKVYFVTTDGEKLTGLNKIGGQTYFFKDNGAMVKSDYVTVDNNTYYFLSDGTMATGFMTKWGSEYYFDATGAQLKDCLFTVDGVTYHVNAKGVVTKSDFVELEDGTHYFDKDGHMAVNTTITKWFKKYTFDENGVLVK